MVGRCIAGGVVLVALVVGIVVIAYRADPQPDPSTAAAQMLQDGGDRVVAVIGDSYTAGTPEGGEGDSGWPALVWKQLADKGIRVKPEVDATGGSGYVNPGPAQVTFLDEVQRTVTPEVRLVLIFGGTNDVEQSKEDLAAAARSTVEAVRVSAPWAKVLLVGPVWPGASPGREVVAVRDVLQTVARSMGADFVDPIHEGWLADRADLIGSDDVHPTDAGHRYLADRLTPRIQTALTGHSD